MKGAPFFLTPDRAEQADDRKKNPGLTPGKRYVVQRIGAFGQSNRVSGNGATLLLAITPAQRVRWAGVGVLRQSVG
ncbi:hypothetical protein PQR02_09480 [Paraburkholderia sediminicola]|uniref:hypothetical protein n=1 Tax=Paraburkholderia sediminicola TaxID=458836 RepID=UPI0038B83711